MIEHSAIQFWPQKTEIEYGTIQTAAMKHCTGCGMIIDGMGGGGLFICKPCATILSTGLLQREFAKAKEELTV